MYFYLTVTIFLKVANHVFKVFPVKKVDVECIRNVCDEFGPEKLFQILVSFILTLRSLNALNHNSSKCMSLVHTPNFLVLHLYNILKGF